MSRFTQEHLEALKRELESLADPAYKAFNEKLLPGVETAYGIRMPALRALAKKLLKEDSLGYLSLSSPGCYEETLLRGLVIAGLKLPWEEKRPWVEEFLPLIDNWAVCDAFCSSLKPRSSQDREAIWEFLKPFYRDRREFFVRFAVVTQLSQFVEDCRLEEGLSLLQSVDHPGYYAKMGVAWALCEWYLVSPRQVDALLARRCLSPWVQNKAIQKIRESRRVDKETKAALLSYKLTEHAPEG